MDWPTAGFLLYGVAFVAIFAYYVAGLASGRIKESEEMPRSHKPVGSVGTLAGILLFLLAVTLPIPLVILGRFF